MRDRVRIRQVETLAEDWGVLKKTTFDYRRADGSWQTMSREVYDRGNGAAILPYDPATGRILLTRQFRLPALASGHAEPLVEACAGRLDDRSPEAAIRAEAEEELGYRIGAPRRVFDCFMSPGSMTERLVFFVAPYGAGDRVSAGGGLAHEGEDIEVLELPLDEALAMVADGRIVDAKTILLLQYAKLSRLTET